MSKQLTEDQALEIIESTGAVRTGHFVLVGERHSKEYVNKDDVSTKPGILDILAASIAEQAWVMT